MENLEKALNSYTVEQLKMQQQETKTFPIIPTEVEIKSIIDNIVAGKSDEEIKRTVRRFEMKDGKQVSAKGFSYEQIKEIRKAIDEKIIKEEKIEVSEIIRP